MSTVQATRLRKGMLIKLGNDLFRVLDLQHFTPGNKRGFVQSRLRSVRAGTLTDHKFRSEDDVERATLDERDMQYLYADGDAYHFMDTTTFEQIHVPAESLGEAVHYLVGDLTIRLQFYDEKPVGVELPQTVDLAVAETTPAIKGATASAQLKPARLETGLVVQVPPFINQGDRVRVSTESGQYLSRS